MSDKISCCICNTDVHTIAIHLRDHHEGVTIESYKEMYPGAPILSKLASDRMAQLAKEKEAREAESKTLEVKAEKKPLHELFSLKRDALSLRADGSPIMIDVLPDTEWSLQVPEVDPNYIFNVEVLKVMIMGMALNIPTYIWGHAGTGKTTIIEQIAAITNRPLIRTQHTGSTEEAHILGQLAATEKGTHFEAGPLPMAMKHGWVYLADEYDFAFPQVLAVYQSVLEGKALVIKEAPADSGWRIVKPHPNFRFFATGNTNGTGDETGLFSGTNVQNAANYERFGIVEKMPYMSKQQEAAVVAAQGGISLPDAERLVQFAHLIRDAFDAKKIAGTAGPRVLINSAKVGVARASFMKGLNNAFINRLSTKDREIVTQIAQRVLEAA